MNKTFIYKEKFAFSYFYPSIAFIALTIGCVIFKYGISNVLTYPYSIYAFSVCAALFLVFGFSKLNKALQSKRNPNPIEIGESEFSFPKDGNCKIIVAYTDITELSTWCSSDTGNEITVHTSTKKYTFKEDNFNNSFKYNSFAEIIQQKYESHKKN